MPERRLLGVHLDVLKLGIVSFLTDARCRWPSLYFQKTSIDLRRHGSGAPYRNLIYFHEVDKGGLFAAWEQPELFAAELRAAVRTLR